MKKRLCALFLALLMLLPTVAVPTAMAGEGDTYEVSDFAEGTAPEKEGYVFAGWYTDSTFTTPYTADRGIATAKFVAQEVLSVKYQINDGTDADSASTRLRIVTTVDSLDYREVGFIVQWAGEEARTLTTTKVYRELTGYEGVSSVTYTPTRFAAESRYFCAYNFTVPNERFDTDFTITPVWVTRDGTRVTGMRRTICITGSVSYAVRAGVVGYELTGSWAIDRVSGTTASPTYAPKRSYDGDAATFWNPQATDYASGEGIVYRLDQAYDLTKVQLTFSGTHYFDLYVSSDGENYEPVHRVTRANAGYYYSNRVCTVKGLTLSDITHVKILFTGSNSGDYFLSVYEAVFTGKKMAVGSDSRPEVAVGIVDHALLGAWAREYTAGNPPAQSYDGKNTTMWNPQATDYASGEGIVYTLEGAYDLAGISMQFAAKDHYLDLYASGDGETYTLVRSITAENAATYYSDHVCTVTGLRAYGVTHIKIIFTGRSDNGLFINFCEMTVTGREPAVPEEPDMPEEVAVGIAAYDTGNESTWAKVGGTGRMADKSFDADSDTSWNASIKQNTSAVVYTLSGTYSLTGATLTWDRATTYFDLYVSSDGENWTAAASVTSSSGHYTGNVSTLTGMDTAAASYVKLVFTGTSGTWFSLYEIALTGIPAQPPAQAVSAGITGCELLGTYVKEYTTGHLPAHSYDGDTTTMWNPQATANYASGEGVVYMLDDAYDLTKIQLYFTARDHYFDLYASSDGKAYTKLVGVMADNASEYYTDHICTVAGLETASTRYVKILFTGSSDAGTYIDLREASVFGREASIKTALDEVDAPICGYQLTGTWIKDYSTGNPPASSYDGNPTTKWNPQASGGFSGAPGIVYTLDQAYDLTQLTLTFTVRRYYFDLYVSSYGTDYTRLAQITSANAEAYYDGYTCTLRWDAAENVKHVKLVFTGGDSLYVNLNEIALRGCVSGDTADLSARTNATAQLAATDSLGRTVASGGEARDGKAVGIFYFLWLGAYSSEGPYDVSAVKAADANAARSNEAWLASGGGAVGQRHWWGQSLFGYYRADDEWVVERDVQMLTDAGVDFLALDYSNEAEYPRQLLVLLAALDKYYAQGFSVPQLTFITKSGSAQAVMDLYRDFYLGHPEYAHLWYCMDGKPLMIGVQNPEEVTEECAAYFTWRYPQWPRETYHKDGFPWMDFGSWTQSGKPAVFGGEDSATVMSVSVAQHSGTLAFSSSALYGDDTNHTRSYHNGANDTAEDAVLYGYNFGEQFEYAIEQDPDIIFVTGWNEWIATRQGTWYDVTDPVILVDNCDINNSRDIQPMSGGYGDNYYMQMISYIRQYKGLSASNNRLNTAAPTENVTIDVGGTFDQWNVVRPFYLDYTGDTLDRNHAGFGSLVYADDTGRNDLYKMKMANDESNLYAYAETAEDIVGMDGGRCMTLFLSTGGAVNWCGYDCAINRTAAGNTLSVERWNGSAWVQVGTASYMCSGNRLQLALPLSLLGLTAGDIDVQFKWADNYQEEDVYNFYLHGDAAPYGRLNYVYRNTEA